jgi:undecaprenyl-diphosphatase
VDHLLQSLLVLNPGALADAARAITMLGDPLVVLFLVVLLNWRQWTRMSVLLVGSLALRLIYGVLKDVIGRERPEVAQQIVHASGYAMPSGHAAGVAFVAVIVFAYHRKFRWLACVAALFVGWSRIALGVHFPSDVLVGWCVGALIGFACIRLLERVETTTNVTE